MSADRSWMKRRVDPHDCSLTEEFKHGVEEFLDFAYNNPRSLGRDMIKCPCLKCELLKFQDRQTVTIHLYQWGFQSLYTSWFAHGETSTTEVHEDNVTNDDAQRANENRYRGMVIDAAGPDLRENSSKEAPNSEATKFFKLLEYADQPLWKGCKNHTRLSSVSQLMNCKSEFNMSESCYNRVASLVKSMLPEDAVLPEDFYQSKKMVKELILAYEKIPACPNDCMLYWKEHKFKKKCIVCGQPGFKEGKRVRGKRTEVPLKVLRYLPLTPRLQRLFMSNKTAKYMSWHKDNRRPEGILTHPSDGEAWKHFDRTYPSFAADGRNVRLGLSTDGFNPFGHSSISYSCWPVFVTPYNLPPWMCMKEGVLFLTLILCKLEKIFPPSFFDSMEHLPIHLAYEAKVGGPVQYRWMYPFERCMMNLKKKVRNRACVEGSICEAYLIQETATFCSHYFEPHVQTKLNRVPRNDDGGYVSDKCKLHVFGYPCRPFGTSTERLLDESEFKSAERYVLLNCVEIMPFVTEFDDLMISRTPNIRDGELDHLRDLEFSKWVKGRVRQDMTIDENIRDLCNGPNKYATCYNTCFVNGYKFHTKNYSEQKTTINSGVCIKGSCYNDFEKDYFGILLDVVQLHYVGGNRVTLFKCHWYDTEKGVKVDSKHGLVDINSKSTLGGNDPFVLAEQAQQVYYTTYPSRKRSRSEWLAVCKTKARSTYNDISNIVEDDEITPTMEGFYQEDEMPPPTIVGVDVDLDDVFTLPSTEVEEVEPGHVSSHVNTSSNTELHLDEEEEFEEEDTEDEDDGYELSSSDNE